MTKQWLTSAAWILFFWSLVFLVVSASPEDIPYCPTYEQC